MTATAITIDPIVLDVLADPDVVDAVSRFVGFERAIRAAYATPVNAAEIPHSGWGGSPEGDQQRYIAAQVHDLRARRDHAAQALGQRLVRRVEDFVRESEAS